MVSIVINQLVNTTQQEAFDIAQDYDLRLAWDPFLTDIKFISKDKTMKRGLKVWVKSKNRLEMIVEYVNYVPPKHVAMKMVTGPQIFSNFSGVWTFKAIEATSTLITFQYKFNMKPWFWILTFPTRGILKRDMRLRLESLKDYLERT